MQFKKQDTPYYELISYRSEHNHQLDRQDVDKVREFWHLNRIEKNNNSGEFKQLRIAMRGS